MKPVCDHIGLFTDNAQRIKEFYIRVFDFESGDETTLSEKVIADIFGIKAECRFIKLYKEGFILEIFNPLSAELQKYLAPRIGINHWGCCVKERDMMIEKLRENKVPLIEIRRNDRTAYFVVDPDGNRIELRECRE